MIFISLIGAASAPIMLFISLLNIHSKQPNSPLTFQTFFDNTNLYVLLLLASLLYGVMTAYLFNREYAENTLKNLLTIPVSKVNLMISKMILLGIWILVLTFMIWTSTFILGIMGGFEGLTPWILWKSFSQFMIGGFFIFLLTTPIIFITILLKSYVPAIIFSACITMANVLMADSEYKAVFPWSAVHTVASNSFTPEFPASYSMISILATSILGFMASIFVFKKSDI